jgi:transposase
MEKVSTIGLDIAKTVFQVEGTTDAGEVTIRRQLRRSHLLKFFARLSPCLVGMEACASAHHWARELTALGHAVRLMPPRRVKAYVKWGAKNDQADAAACNEAVTRPSMQFVPIKSIEQQGVLMLHRARSLLDKQCTQLSNAIRGHLAEFGIVAAKGHSGFASLLAKIGKDSDPQIPPVIRPIVMVLVEQWRSTCQQMDKLERQIIAWHKSNGAANGWPRYPNLVRSPRAPWWLRWVTLDASRTDVLMELRLAWSRAKTRQVESRI